jgi:hypothetical protein
MKTKFNFLPNNDGRADIAVFRPSNGTWFRLSSANNNQFNAVQFGQAGDAPMLVDFDGDGKTDIAVYREARWLVQQSSNNQFSAIQFGLSTDKPVPAAYLP